MIRPTLIAVLLLASAANAWELKHDSTGSLVHWASAPHFVVDASADQKLGEPRAFAAVQAAIEAVDAAAPNLEITVEEGEVEGVGYDPSPGAVNRSEIVVPEDWDYDPSTLAITVVTVDISRHVVIDADIAFNAAHRKFKVLPENSHPGGDYDDIQNALTHELGHAVGLAHNPDAPEAVMYPGSRKGEVSKRTLSNDDVEGLLQLYPAPADSADPAAPDALAHGCSSSGSRTAPWALALALLAWPLLRRTKELRTPAAAPAFAAALLCLAALPAPAAEHAAEPAARQTAEPAAGTAAGNAAGTAAGPAAGHEDAALLGASELVVTAEVVSARPLPSAGHSRLWFTELEVRVRQCVKVKGTCPATLKLRAPGGRVGTLEQVVEDHPVPSQGELIAVVAPATRALPRLYRLGQIPELVAFARALGASGLSAQLPLPVSATPSRYAPTPSP